jgi:integrase
MVPLVFTRPGELRHAQWKDIDLDAAEWCFPLSKTPTGEEARMLLVPLSRQAVEILRELQPFTGKGRFVFPNPRTPEKPMSENAVLAALRNMGFPQEVMTGHGFRATARTILDEVLGIRPDIIEHQLGHVVRDPLGQAYNRTKFLADRRVMMQQWADFCDTLRAATPKP